MNTATLFAPELVKPTGINLRDYQERAIKRTIEEFDAGRRSTLVVMPTGTGKTYMAGSLIRQMAEERGWRTLALAHRGELIDQAADAFTNLGLFVGIEKASSRGLSLGEPHAVIATVQTLQGRRLQSWPRDYFDLIWTDEAHHAPAQSYLNVYDHFRTARHLGVTATADRGDKINLGCVFDSVAFEYSLLDAMTAPAPGPYLSRLEVVQCDIPIDLRAIRTTAGDLNAADLEEALRPHVEPIANAIKREVEGRSTLVFTPDVNSAMAIATACQSLGMRAAWVSGDDPDRAEKIRKFKDADIQVLCNCALLTEGFDAPRTSAIVLCRPTKSRALYAQMIGRGTRLWPGKENCRIIDFEWICGRHQLVKPVELLSTRMTSDDDDEAKVQKRAQELIDSGEESDLLEAIEEAGKEIEEAKRRREISIAARERNTNYRRVRYDPLAGYHAIGMPTTFPREARPLPATEKQLETLRNMGVQVNDDISRRRASMMLDVLIGRVKQGLASKKQVDWMIANGVPAEEASQMSFQDASRTLDRLFNRAG